jgi:hypothetical protein
MNRRQIEEALAALNEKLRERGIIVEMGLFGGAAMVLKYRVDVVTKDIDAIFLPQKDIGCVIGEVGVEHGLPDGWMNDEVRKYLLPGCEPEHVPMLEFSHLKVWSPPAEYLLAMKCMACRAGTRDREDIGALARHLRIGTVDGVMAVVKRYVPAEFIMPKARVFIEQALCVGASTEDIPEMPGSFLPGADTGLAP